jgi:hypothetical protein
MFGNTSSKELEIRINPEIIKDMVLNYKIPQKLMSTP